jgi:NCS1 family nucleobase:cation symporter-1
MVPWTAVNLVDYYLIRRGHYDVPSFFAADGGVYGMYNPAALACYLLGILVQLPFIASDVYTGPVARAMGDIDLSWVVGLLVVSAAYYFAVRPRLRPIEERESPPSRIRHPSSAADKATTEAPSASPPEESVP